MAPGAPPNHQPSKTEPGHKGKKVYMAPTVLRWGEIHELTKTVGITGGFDNGLHVTRTSLGGLARVPNSETKRRGD
jgi:hypothetical protein